MFYNLNKPGVTEYSYQFILAPILAEGKYVIKQHSEHVCEGRKDKMWQVYLKAHTLETTQSTSSSYVYALMPLPSQRHQCPLSSNL